MIPAESQKIPAGSQKRVRNSAKRPESFGTFFHLPRSAKLRPFRQDLEYLRKSAIFARQRHYTPQHSKASYVFGKRCPPLLSAAAQRAETGLRSGCHRENLSTAMGRHLPHGGRSGRMRGDRRRHGASARKATAAAGYSAPLGLDGRKAGETLPPPAGKDREDGGSLRRKRHPHARTEGAGAEQGLPRSGAS